MSLAWADSPDGPWTKAGDPVIPLGGEEAWDGSAIHDPLPSSTGGKVWLSTKGNLCVAQRPKAVEPRAWPWRTNRKVRSSSTHSIRS